jgi:hypothetical protein
MALGAQRVVGQGLIKRNDAELGLIALCSAHEDRGIMSRTNKNKKQRRKLLLSMKPIFDKPPEIDPSKLKKWDLLRCKSTDEVFVYDPDSVDCLFFDWDDLEQIFETK